MRSLWTRFKQELDFWRVVWRHPRTPRLARWLLGFALVYAVTPFDIIPDFIPVLGQLDDVVIIPLLLAIAVRLVPKALLSECRAASRAARSS